MTPREHVEELIKNHGVDPELKNLLMACIESAVLEEREECALICDNEEYRGTSAGKCGDLISKRTQMEAINEIAALSQEYELYDDFGEGTPGTIKITGDDNETKK